MKSGRRPAMTLLLGAYAILGVLLVGGWTPHWLYVVSLPLMTLLGMAFALLHAAGHMGWRRALAFWGIVFLTGLTLESVGVRTGWPYGPYHYTAKLGPRFLGLVPYAVPLAWFMMIYPSWVIARRALTLVGLPRRVWLVALLTAWVMTSWDFLMDPLMTHFHHWVWETPGAYFGVPLQNFFGWLLTVFLAVWLFGKLGRPPALHENTTAPLRWAVVWYGLVFLSNFAAAWQAGLYGPTFTGAWVMAPWMAIGWVATGSRTAARSVG